MRKIKEILRLKFDLKLADRQIAGSYSIPPGLSWPLPEGMDDTALEAQLFASACRKPAQGAALPDFAWIHEELRRHKPVTMVLLWQEYKQAHPDGYQYSRFCQLYNEWARKLDRCYAKSIGPDPPSRWWAGRLERFVTHRFSSLSLVPVTIPMPKRPGTETFLAGLGLTFEPWSSFKVCRRPSCRTTGAQG